MRSRKTERGFTLVELMVAMTIGLFLLAGIGLLYLSAKTGFNYAGNTVRLSEDASFAIDTMSRDIRMAGFSGCAGNSINAGADGLLNTADDVLFPDITSLAGVTLTGVSQPNPFSNVIYRADNVVRGFPSGTSTDAVTARTALGTSTQYTIQTNSPILYLAGGASQALQLTADTATTIDRARIGTTDTYKWDDNFGTSSTPRKPLFIIANCNKSEIFQASSMSTVSGEKALVAENDVFVNSYSTDALIMPLQTATYFIATPARAGANPSLYKRNFNGAVATVEEIVPNVEAMRIHYGENTSNNPSGDPTFITDVYRETPDAVTDWSRVVSIRIGVVLVSEEGNLSDDSVATPTLSLLGSTYTPASSTDRKLRRVYSTTVSIRNRMGL